MKSDMTESASSLVPVNYVPYLTLLLRTVKRSSLFTVSPQNIHIASAQVAEQFVRDVQALEQTNSPLPPLFSYSMNTRLVTVHMEDEQNINEMGRQIEALREAIKNNLVDVIQKSTLPFGTPNDYLSSLPTRLKTLHRNGQPQGLHYPFLTSQSLSKRRVHLYSRSSRPSSAAPRYRGHKLSITLERTGTFEDDLIDGFCSLTQALNAIPQEVAEVRDVLEHSKKDPASELSRLKKLVKDETLGKIKSEASYQFWNAVVEDMAKVQAQLSSVSQEDAKGLAEMQRQLQMLKRLHDILQSPSWSDTAFQVSYEDEAFNMKTTFARATAYDISPIFPEVVGTLGEVLDMNKDEQKFIYGMRFKLNGNVGKVPSAFQYYAALLDPTHPEHKERLTSPYWNKRWFAEEVMHIAVLYSVLFLLPNDDTFEEKLRNLFKHLATDDPQTKAQYLRVLSKLLLKRNGNIIHWEDALEHARGALEKYFSYASVGPTITPFVGYLILNNGMLKMDRNRMLMQKRFFRPELFNSEEQRKEALRYMTIEDAVPQQNAFYALPITLTFEPIYLSEDQASTPETANMTYAIDDWLMFPLLFVPDTKESLALAQSVYGTYKHALIPYYEKNPFPVESSETALYHWAFLLLTYVSAHLLWAGMVGPLSRQQQRLFYPMIRIHTQEQETGREQVRFPSQGKIMRGMTKALAHMFSCENFTLSNAQGFTHEALQPGSFRMGNGLSSLYNVLPRLITRPPTAPNALDKLAIIVISSRKSDQHGASTFQKMCVYGEVIGCTRLPDGKLRVERLSTFAVNEDSNNLYTTPRTLLDLVRRCSQAGFQHIFYIAKAPYTSHVHFTGKEDGEELFFMSPDIIEGVLQAFPNIRLYPMFCDRYYVAKVSKAAMPESLYVDDARELRTLFTDPSKSTVAFFNVMNGFQVKPQKGEKGHRYYYGVVNYATLINMYDNPLYDQSIRNNLLDPQQPGSLHADMLDFLSYVHGVRYERREKQGVQLKLDPYEEYIGFDSVGARSILPSADSRVRTNILALLTLIRGQLRRRKAAPGPTPPPSPTAAPSVPSVTTKKGASDAR